jgi:hypothetical protein
MMSIDDDRAFDIVNDFLNNCRINGTFRGGCLTKHRDEFGVHLGFIAIVGPQRPRDLLLNTVLLGLAVKFVDVKAATYYQGDQSVHTELRPGETFLVCVVSSSPQFGKNGLGSYAFRAQWIQDLAHTAFVTVNIGN